MEEVEKIFKKNEENKKKIRAEVLKQLEERINNERYKFRWIFGQDIWIVIYISVFSLLISGCFFFLFTGFSISGKLEALDKEEETVVESTDANFNNGNNKKGAEKK